MEKTTVNLYPCNRCKTKVHAIYITKKQGRTESIHFICPKCGDQIVSKAIKTKQRRRNEN